MKVALAAADWQIPFDDPQMTKLFLEVVKDVQPNLVILGGDILDLPYCSTKFINPAFPKDQLIDDLYQAMRLIVDINVAAPRASVIYIEGNHEARLSNLVLERAPALQVLLGEKRALSMTSLIDPDNDLDFQYVGPYDSVYEWGRLLFKHGERVGPHPATGELAMEGSSGMSFHCHRFDTAVRTDRSGAHGWWSIGCMCQTSGPDRPPSAHKGHNRFENWQQGFALIEQTSGAAPQYAVTPLIATDHKVILGGKVYGPTGLAKSA